MKNRQLFRWVVLIIGLLGVYFFTRLVAIKSLPPFNDEFIYVRWAQEGFFDPGKRLLSLTDGKQPLYIWLVSLLMNIIPSPLAAGRMVSVFSGATTMIGLVFLSWFLFRSRLVAIGSGLLYILFPLALLLDRFALYDSLLASLAVWSVIVMILLVRGPSLGPSFLLAHLLGASLLTKSSATLLMVSLPLAIAFFEPRRARWMKIAGYFVLAASMAFLYQSVQQLSAEASFIGQKNQTFVYTWDELRNMSIFPSVLKNVLTYGQWVFAYFSLPIILIIGGISYASVRNRSVKYLLASFTIPFLIVVVIGKLIYARHLFFILMPLLIVASLGLVTILARMRTVWQKALVAVVCLSPMLYTSGGMLTNYKMAKIPEIDRFQYVNGWPSGWGVKDIVRFLEGEAAKGEITVITEGVFGSLPTTAMRLYFGNYPQVRIVPFDGEKPIEIPEDVRWDAPVYLILNRAQSLPHGLTGEELLKIQKGDGDSYIRLYRILMVDDEGLGPPTSSV